MNANKKNVKNLAVEQKRHWVRLTHVCNQNCIFCHDKDNQKGGIVAFDDVCADLKKGRRQGCTRAILSGGDPTLHPDLIEIIQQAKGLGYDHVQLITNGRMLCYKDFTQSLKAAGLDEITLSLHSHRREPFEKMTQVPGSYQQAMQGLMNALDNRFIVSVDIVLNKINYRDVAETMKFFMRMGVTEFDLLHIVPFSNAWESRDDVFFPVRDAKKYLDKAFALSRTQGVYVWTNRLPANYLEGYEELIQHPSKLADEIRGRERDFKDFIQEGRPIPCHGERCQYCFMREFCLDLIELRDKKILSARQSPKCRPSPEHAVQKAYRFCKTMNIYDFLDFFIAYRYYVKSFRCEACTKTAECDGAQINEIREKGFKILNPV